MLLHVVVALALVELAGSWISLSEKGYSVKHSLIAQAGVKVSGPVKVNGLMISRPVARLQCNPSRRGAMRWNDEKFEACDGETDWRPLTFCSNSCDIDTRAVPCGLAVKNTCDKSCEQIGTGLNMRQCILNVGSTACGAPVVDLCGNACGLEGQMACEDNSDEFGLVAIRSVEKGITGGNTSFQFKVGSVEKYDNSMFLSFQKEGDGEQLLRFRRVLEHEADYYPAVPLSKAVWNHSSTVKEEPFGSVQGLEIGKPDGRTEATTRISMYTELTGGYIRLGHKDGAGENPSHVFVDGTVDKECPFLFNAGNYEEHDLKIGKASYFTKVCLETSPEDLTISVPDASGVVLTQGNEEDMRSLPGLRGRNVIVHTSAVKDLLHIQVPSTPRIDCAAVQCTEAQTLLDGSIVSSCADVPYDRPELDAFRLFYNISRPADLRGISNYTQEILRKMENEGATRWELTRHFISLLYLEMGLGEINLPSAFDGMSTFAALRRVYDDIPVDAERCFACCCGSYPASGGGGTNAAKELCRPVKYRPQFCLNSPIGSGKGERWNVHLPECKTDADCSKKGWAGSPCGTDEEKILCLEGDLDWYCWDISIRGNLTTTVDFKEPESYQILSMPAASGTVVSTDNLQDLTSLGVQQQALVAQSGPETQTTIAFESAPDATNNTLLIPNAADGILLSTGNLEDVTVDSGYMTGLRVSGNVHVRGSLRFDGSPMFSGLMQSPTEEPSDEYIRPHSGLKSSAGRPAHVRFRVSESTTVLEFEPAAVGVDNHHLTVRPVSGTMISTGNLEAVTAQSGSMTSLEVEQLSYLQGGVIVGTRGQTQMMIQGNQRDTITFNSTHPKSKMGEDFSTTVFGFDLSPGKNASISFAAESGTVITTGNLPDIFEFTGKTINVSGSVHLRGPVAIGEGTFERAAALTPVMFSGHVEGSIMHRQNPPRSKNHPIGDVPYPFTWGERLGKTCKGVPGITRAERTSSWPGAAHKFDVDANHVMVLTAPYEVCKAKCEDTQGCGILTVGRSFRARLLNLKNFPEERDYIGVALRKIEIDPTSGKPVTDSCYPGFDDLDALFDVNRVYDLDRFPLIASHWLAETDCQGVIATTENEFRAQWGDAAAQLNELEVSPVRCMGMPVGDLNSVDMNRGCQVLVRSHMTASFLRAAPLSECLDQSKAAADGGSACARWASSPSLWSLLPYTGPIPEGADAALGSSGYAQLRRDGVCVEVSPDESKVLSCGEGDRVASITFANWGETMGLCGAYEAATSCAGGFGTAILEQLCFGDGGCSLELSAQGYLTVRSVASGAQSPFWQPCAGNVRVAASCETRMFLAGKKPTSRPHFKVVTEDAVASLGDPLETVFHLHSDPVSPVASYQAGSGVGFDRQCWLANKDAFTCELATDPEMDVSLFMRYHTTELDFAEPTAARTQLLPDASGTILTSGNLLDVTNLRGLKSSNTFMYRHGNQLNAPTTIVDFAAVGTAPDSRSDGALPKYDTSTDEDPHPKPPGANRRITFPDATGTVITTGNIDDLVFKKISLRGLVLDGEAEFMNSIGNKAVINFRNTSRIAGCLNFAREMNAEAGKLVTQLCEERPSQQNEILLPDASGVVLTTGNLLNLPSMRFNQSALSIGGDVSLEGDVQLGAPGTTATSKMHAHLDGDVGLSFAAPTYASGETRDNVLRLHAPHMGGVDIAIRHYLTYGVAKLPVDIQWEQSFRDTVPGTERLNQSRCNVILTQQHVHDAHGLGYFLHRHGIVQRTLIQGTPYSAAEIPGNQTYPACWSKSTEDFVCHGPSPWPCGCRGLNEEMVVTWRPVGRELLRLVAPPCSPGVFDCGPRLLQCKNPAEPSCVFDSDTKTFYESDYLSTEQIVEPMEPIPSAVATFQAYSEPHFTLTVSGRCVVGQKLSNPVNVSWVRIFPRPGRASHMRGGLLQAGRNESVNGVVEWHTLHNLADAPLEGVWNDIPVANPGPGNYTHLRYLGPACGVSGVQDGKDCRCDAFEWEWHNGLISQRFHPLQGGARSYFIDEARVTASAVAAMVLKCAGRRWYPAYLRSDVQEITLPETSGTLLTSGNLQDVTMEAGTLTSLRVAGGAAVGGNTVLGFPGSETEMVVHSALMGRFPLALAGGGEMEAAVTLTVPDPTSDSLMTFPPEAGGTIVTTASLPALSVDMQVVSASELRGPAELTANVRIGDDLSPSSLLLNAHIGGAFPLTFSAGAGRGPLTTLAGDRVSLGVELPSADRTLVLPDVTGIVITSGSMPQVFEESTLVGSTLFEGHAKFTGGNIHGRPVNVVFGQRDESINVEINSAIGGSLALVFEGTTADSLTLSLAVEEPTGSNVLSLPDVSGTVITTGNFPEAVESLHVLGDLVLDGDLVLTADAGRLAEIGHPHRRSKLQLHSVITGRYPLVFGEQGAEGASHGDTTTLEVTPPSADNLISFPDTSGTVITTGNIPDKVMVADDYNIHARSLQVVASSVAIGAEAREPDHAGCFVFADAAHETPTSGDEGGFGAWKENSFNVRATGGARLVSGYTSGGKEIGVLLEKGSSAWSVLSDASTKHILAEVDEAEALRTLEGLSNNVPVSTWTYEGHSTRHMGPMAQDLHAVFGLGESRERISGIDADGVAMAGVQGISVLQRRAKEQLQQLWARLRGRKERLQKGWDEIARNRDRIARTEAALQVLERQISR